MPRDKKTIHRSTSDVEDEVISDEELIVTKEETDSNEKPSKLEDPNTLNEERKKYLRDAILKRTLALKQQRERDRQQNY